MDNGHKAVAINADKPTSKVLDSSNHSTNTAPILEAAAGTLNELKEREMEKVPESQILNVWSSNLQDAMRLVEDLIEEYPYIALVCCPRNVSPPSTLILALSLTFSAVND